MTTTRAPHCLSFSSPRDELCLVLYLRNVAQLIEITPFRAFLNDPPVVFNRVSGSRILENRL